MCGIYGYFDTAGRAMPTERLVAMAASIRHRGPDEQGVADRPGDGVAIGCERLAIIDRKHGQQPFVNESGSVAVVQNGAIFNHRELAAEYATAGHRCRTGSDTEVLLRGYEHRGIDFVEHLNGMFAVAIHDRDQDCLYLVRDRVGEKPLFYSYVDGRLVFGSEIKAILAATGRPSPCPSALGAFLRFNYVPPPATMFDNVHHVLPGHWIRVDRSGVTSHRYWDAADVEVAQRTPEAWIECFDEIFEDAVRIRLSADDPPGAFLSGGVDSSSVVGQMARLSEAPVETFSIGFEDPRFDESKHAAAAAERFRTQHHCEVVDPDMIASWQRVLHHCDQPHGDASFMPTLRLAELASHHVRVVLTGDGADELFAGYDSHRRFFAAPGATVDRSYLEHISLFDSTAIAAVAANEDVGRTGDAHFEEVLEPLLRRVEHFDELSKGLYLDLCLLLPGNNLVKPDRLGMAVAIENRSPFLDHRLVELAFSMPGDLKLRDGTTKYIQKRAVAPLIGETLAYRKKQMFTVPIGEWLKGALHERARRLLLSDTAMSRELFDSAEVDRLFRTHRDGTANHTRELRGLLAVELWMRHASGEVDAWGSS